MRVILKTVLAIAFLALLAACSSGPPKRVNPPKASIQQLAVQPDGRWKITLRLQNYSNVSTEFASIDATLHIGGQDAGRIFVEPGIAVGPESADVVEATITPTLGAKLVVASAIAARQSSTYTLTGSIRTSKPKGNYNFTHDSQLDPAPGLNGVMR